MNTHLNKIEKKRGGDYNRGKRESANNMIDMELQREEAKKHE